MKSSRPPKHTDIERQSYEYRSVSEVVGYDVISLMDIDPSLNFDEATVYEEHYQTIFMFLELEGKDMLTVARTMNRNVAWVAGIVSGEIYQRMLKNKWRPMEYCSNKNIADTTSLDPNAAPEMSNLLQVSITKGKCGHAGGSKSKTFVPDVEGFI